MFGMAGRIKKIKQINNLANEGIKQKYKEAKEDNRHFALIALELVLVFALVASLVFLFDPTLNFPDAQNISWPIKLALFIAAAIIVVKLYDYTKDFRIEQPKKSRSDNA